MTTPLPPISQLNTQSQEQFVHICNALFEAAPPLASRLYASRPFASYEQLIDTAGTILPASSPVRHSPKRSWILLRSNVCVRALVYGCG